MKKPYLAVPLALLLSVSSAAADNLTTAEGQIVMVEKNQGTTPADLLGNLTVGSLFINVTVASIVLLAVSSNGGT